MYLPTIELASNCAFSPLSCLVRDRRLESAAETKEVHGTNPWTDVAGNLGTNS